MVEEFKAPSPSRKLHRYTSKEWRDRTSFLEMEGILSMAWVKELLDREDTSSVITAGALVAPDSRLPPDHMVEHRHLCSRSALCCLRAQYACA